MHVASPRSSANYWYEVCASVVNSKVLSSIPTACFKTNLFNFVIALIDIWTISSLAVDQSFQNINDIFGLTIDIRAASYIIYLACNK